MRQFSIDILSVAVVFILYDFERTNEEIEVKNSVAFEGLSHVLQDMGTLAFL